MRYFRAVIYKIGSSFWHKYRLASDKKKRACLIWLGYEYILVIICAQRRIQR